MAKPFIIREDREFKWIKEWLIKQALEGRLGASVDFIQSLSLEGDYQRFITSYLDVDARKRLQKALSRRRTHADSGFKDEVTTRLSSEARDMLLKVAESRGITTSDLITDVLLAEFLKIH